MKSSIHFFLLCFLKSIVSGVACGQQIKPEVTEDWSNKPPIVSPGKTGSPPSDAIVLFTDNADLVRWESADGTAVKWKAENGVLQVIKDAGNIQTKQKFGSVQLHIEWMTPDPAEDQGTSRGNSGVLLMGLYELQIYESYNYQSRLYYNGIAGSVYKQYPPLVNACLPPQTWQSYDIIFDAPVFYSDKTLKQPAYITVFHNGVLIQNHVRVKGPMVYAGYPEYRYHDSKLPLQLQEHDSRVSFRNIWIRELDAED